MKTVKKWTWFKIALLVSAMSLALLGPSPALAWFEFCGVPGRMTGGGSICLTVGGTSDCVDMSGGGRVTQGFELHCDGSLPNNLEINDHIGKNRFKLGILLQANCVNDPTINPQPPLANFNTFIGLGFGTWDGNTKNACIQFTYTDAGEPGTNDQATILITDGGFVGNGLCDAPPVGTCTGNVLLQIGPANLTFGDFQAHNP